MENYIKILKRTWQLLKFNLWPLLLFTVIYTPIAWLFSYGISNILFSLELKAAGLTYLSNDCFTKYLTNPVTWICTLLILLISTMIIMFQVSAMIKVYDASSKQQKVHLSQIIMMGFEGMKEALRLKNFFLIIYVILVLPVLGITLVSNMSYSLQIPDITWAAIKNSIPLMIVLTIAVIALVFYVILETYLFHAMILDHLSFREAAVKSRRLIKKKIVYTLVIVGGTYLILLLILVLAGMLFGTFLTLIHAKNTGVTFLKILYTSLLFAQSLAAFICPSLVMALVMALYEQLSAEKGENRCLSEYSGPLKEKLSRPAAVFVSVYVIFCLGLFIYYYSSDNLAIVMKNHRPEIAAHRGDSLNAPENTMPAFELAVEEGISEWIELDVHQTKDRVLVVAHDDSLERITGEDLCIHDLTYEELLTRDFGKRFSEKYEGTRVSTLDEVLKAVKGKIKVQIEIKPTDYDQEIEQQVVDVIRDNDMVDDVVVLSLQDEPLRRVKKIDPEIITMACMTVSAGEVTDIDFAKYISIAQQNVTDELVDSMHAQGRKVYVWTINSASPVQELVDMGVDVILTDDPELMNQALNECDYSGGITKLLRTWMRV